MSSALQGTAPSPAGASASSRALAREEWLRRRESHLEDARRAQQLQKEREVAHYFSPEINKVRATQALPRRRPKALALPCVTATRAPHPPPLADEVPGRPERPQRAGPAGGLGALAG